MNIVEHKDGSQSVASVVEHKDSSQSVVSVVYYACSRSDGILNNVRCFDDMGKQEQDAFKRELIITSAKVAGYKIKSSDNICKSRRVSTNKNNINIKNIVEK